MVERHSHAANDWHTYRREGLRAFVQASSMQSCTATDEREADGGECVVVRSVCACDCLRRGVRRRRRC